MKIMVTMLFFLENSLKERAVFQNNAKLLVCLEMLFVDCEATASSVKSLKYSNFSGGSRSCNSG